MIIKVSICFVKSNIKLDSVLRTNHYKTMRVRCLPQWNHWSLWFNSNSHQWCTSCLMMSNMYTFMWWNTYLQDYTNTSETDDDLNSQTCMVGWFVCYYM